MREVTTGGVYVNTMSLKVSTSQVWYWALRERVAAVAAGSPCDHEYLLWLTRCNKLLTYDMLLAPPFISDNTRDEQRDFLS